MDSRDRLFWSLSAWEKFLRCDTEADERRLWSSLCMLYTRPCLQARVALLHSAICGFRESFADLSSSAGVCVIRCPGRVNLRGMHVDNHGGAVNSVAIDRETVCVAARHTESELRAPVIEIIHLSEKRYRPVRFRLSDDEIIDDDEDLAALSLSPPTSSTSSSSSQQHKRTRSESSSSLHKDSGIGFSDEADPGCLAAYARATVRTLCSVFPSARRRPVGFSAVLTSDIPRGAGLASAHAMVMCLVNVWLVVNNVEVGKLDLLELVRRIEIRVGKVTGLGNQGVMEFSRRGYILHSPFYQGDRLDSLSVRYAQFPSDSYALLVVNSREPREQAGSYNRHYAVPRFAYSIVIALFQEAMRSANYPSSAVAEIDRLSHITPPRFARFGGLVAIYELLKRIPEECDLEELVRLHPNMRGPIDSAAKKFLDPLPIGVRPQRVQLRGPLCFGIAECSRAERFFGLLQQAEDLHVRINKWAQSQIFESELDLAMIDAESPILNEESYLSTAFSGPVSPGPQQLRGGTSASLVASMYADPPTTPSNPLATPSSSSGVAPPADSVSSSSSLPRLSSFERMDESRLDTEGVERRQQKIVDAGRLMTIGHYGDRVTPVPSSDLHADVFNTPLSDGYLDTLIARVRTDPDDPLVQLWNLPGKFGASTPLLDRIQDSLLSLGATGACLTGAGSGGVVIGLVARHDLTLIARRMAEQFPDAEVFEAAPIAGISALVPVRRENRELVRVASGSASPVRARPAPEGERERERESTTSSSSSSSSSSSGAATPGRDVAGGSPLSLRRPDPIVAGDSEREVSPSKLRISEVDDDDLSRMELHELHQLLKLSILQQADAVRRRSGRRLGDLLGRERHFLQIMERWISSRERLGKFGHRFNHAPPPSETSTSASTSTSTSTSAATGASTSPSSSAHRLRLLSTHAAPTSLSPSIARLFPVSGMRMMVTGGGGLIGAHLCKLLLENGCEVVSVDDFNDYYNPAIKYANIEALLLYKPRFRSYHIDIRDREALDAVFSKHRFDAVVHLAARAGVRASMTQPNLYRTVNLDGTRNVFEVARDHGVKDVIYASSSSVYGKNEAGPFSESQDLKEPESVYAGTKQGCERIAHDFVENYGMRLTGLRFFTVDGPLLGGGIGRPDMAIASFVRSLVSKGEAPVTMYGTGDFRRDFTYVEDIVQGVFLATQHSLLLGSRGESLETVYNIGEEDTTSVREVIVMIAAELGLAPEVQTKSVKAMTASEVTEVLDALIARRWVVSLPPPPGDVPLTHASLIKIKSELRYNPTTKIESNIRKTCIHFMNEMYATHGALPIGKSEATILAEVSTIHLVIQRFCKLKLRIGLDDDGRPSTESFTWKDIIAALDIRNQLYQLVCDRWWHRLLVSVYVQLLILIETIVSRLDTSKPTHMRTISASSTGSASVESRMMAKLVQTRGPSSAGTSNSAGNAAGVAVPEAVRRGSESK